MKTKHPLLFAFTAVTVLSSCTGSTGQPIGKALIGAVVPASGTSEVAGVSKYSIRQSLWCGDSSPESIDKPAESILPKQSDFYSSGVRQHWIDHYYDNDTPANIPVNCWRNDFIAGEMALSTMDLSEAKAMFELALKEAGKEQGADAKSHLALARGRLAYLARKAGDLDRAAQLYNEAIKGLTPTSKEEQKALDSMMYDFAYVKWKQQKYSEAERLLRDRLALRENMHGPVGIAVASAATDLANCLFYQNKLKESDKLYLRAATNAMRFKKDTDFSLIASYNLGNCRVAQKKYADALALFESIPDKRGYAAKVEELKSLVASEPSSDREAKNLPPKLGDDDFWKQLIAAAQTEIAANNTFEANQILDVAMTEAKAFGPTDSRIARTALLQADSKLAQGDYRSALPLYESAINDADRTVRGHALTRLVLARLLERNGDGASALLKQATESAPESSWAELVPTVYEKFQQRHFYDNGNAYSSALIDFCVACERAVPKPGPQRVMALSNLAHAYQLAKQSPNALSLYKQALVMAQSIKPTEDDKIAELKTNLALCYSMEEQLPTAEPLLKESLAYYEKNPGKDNRDLRAAIQRMYALYQKWQKPELEEEYYKREIALSATQSTRHRAESRIGELSNLSRIALAKGDYEQAASLLQQSIDLSASQPNARGGNASNIRELIRIEESLGNNEKVEALHKELAQELGGAGQAWRLELYAAAQSALSAGKYADAISLLEKVISDLEMNKQTKDQNFGCYYTEPRYSVCLWTLGNAYLDGDANYDKAITLYDRAVKVFDQSAGPADNSAVIDSRIPHVSLTPEQLVNFVIATDGIGNRERADEYRSKLKALIDQSVQNQARQNNNQPNSLYTSAIAALNHTKRTPSEDISFMEAVANVLHTPGVYSGSLQGDLFPRAITWRQVHGDNKQALADMSDYVHQCIDDRQFDKAQPFALARLNMLKKLNASPAELAVANFDYAEILQERGITVLAKKTYLSALGDLPANRNDLRVKSLVNIAECDRLLQDFDDAVAQLKKGLKIASAGRERADIYARLATVYDIKGDTKQALENYKLAKSESPEKDHYNLFDPLRKAADWAASKKMYDVGDRLYRRDVELLSDENPIAASNSWMQLARMYRWGNRKDEAKKAYGQAIAIYKAHATEPYYQGQVQSAEQEIRQMLSQHP